MPGHVEVLSKPIVQKSQAYSPLFLYSFSTAFYLNHGLEKENGEALFLLSLEVLL